LAHRLAFTTFLSLCFVHRARLRVGPVWEVPAVASVCSKRRPHSSVAPCNLASPVPPLLFQSVMLGPPMQLPCCATANACCPCFDGLRSLAASSIGSRLFQRLIASDNWPRRQLRVGHRAPPPTPRALGRDAARDSRFRCAACLSTQRRSSAVVGTASRAPRARALCGRVAVGGIVGRPLRGV